MKTNNIIYRENKHQRNVQAKHARILKNITSTNSKITMNEYRGHTDDYVRDNVNFNISTKHSKATVSFAIIFLLLSQVTSSYAQETTPTSASSFLSQTMILSHQLDLPLIEINVNEMKCQDKLIGRSEGLICEFENRTHILKTVAKFDDLASLKMQYNPSTAISSAKLIEAISHDIVQPKFTLFLAKVENTPTVYLGSELIKDFKMGETLFNSYFCDRREAIENAIGLNNFHRLIALGTLIPDVLNIANWGYDSIGNLVIIDGDDPLRRTFKDFYDNFLTTLGFLDFNEIYLNKKDVMSLKSIYLNLIQCNKPQSTPTTDISEDAYRLILETYSLALTDTLNNSNEFSNEINTYLREAILNAFLAIDSKGIFNKKVAVYNSR